MRRVAITGLGLITPLGTGVEATWAGLIEGRSAVGPLRGFDAASLRTQLGGEITDFDPQQWVTNRRVLRMMTRNDQLALAGAVLAVRDSGLDLASQDPERVGLFVGSSKEVSDPLHLLDAVLVSRGPDGAMDFHRMGEASSTVYPLFFVNGLQAGSLFYISDAFGLKGANAYFAGMADSGLTAVGSAYRAIRRGEADAAIAGGFDDGVSWWNMSKFDAFGLMTQRNDLGAAACRPYDRDRSGTVMGEGAALLFLEEFEAARKRGARVYAEVTGYGSAGDGYRLITPHPEGRGLTRAVQSALREAGSTPEDIGYIAAHGSGTRLGDPSEARGIRAALGGAADQVASSSVKPATGHLVGGAGALNAAVAALAVHSGVLPPMLNLERPDPACRLDWVTREARQLRPEQALALARGLEGQNVALALRGL